MALIRIAINDNHVIAPPTTDNCIAALDLILLMWLLLLGGDPTSHAVLMGDLWPIVWTRFTLSVHGNIWRWPSARNRFGQFSGIADDMSTIRWSSWFLLEQHPPPLMLCLLSAEYPEFVGQIYNDRFETNAPGSAFTGNAAWTARGTTWTYSMMLVATASADLMGSGFENGVGGGTGVVNSCFSSSWRRDHFD